MTVTLTRYQNETEMALSLIRSFWKEHNGYTQTIEEATEDLQAWTRDGHVLYFIKLADEFVGFIHLGSRGGAAADWLEDIYVLSKYQNKGIGTKAIKQIEEIVKEYSESLYIEAAARNDRAIRLYRRMGYDCLNTITVRKDFRPDNYETIGQEQIFDQCFEIKQYKV